MPVASETSLPPLAIIGLSLKFPQGAECPESFWQMIVEGRCASTEFPPDRLNIDSHYHPDSNRLDTLSVRGAHFMRGDLSAFDAPFFSLTATEAEAMDPQQRLILEMTYRALENAGLSMDVISGSKTSVFTGSFGHDYLMLQVKDTQTAAKYQATGTSMNMLSNRVSWFFNLIGPSVTVDTACSSSLVALDLTCQSIWSGNASMGLAIGSNVILALDTALTLDNLGLLGRDSRCYTFDRRANGYARGEGIGVLVVKPLHDAIRDHDTVRAVIRSSGSNQDGKTPGITNPSLEMQERLIRDTYLKASLNMATTGYVEAHGTGTPVGDPIEARAIGRAFRRYRSSDEPLYVGSVKSTVGHLEGASGIAGVIKVVLALEKGVIPPNSTNFENLNPKIDDEFLKIKIAKTAIPWRAELRRASVSSFGFGGSNSHIVLDDAYNFLRINGLQGRHNTCPEPLMAAVLSRHGEIMNGTVTSDSNGRMDEYKAIDDLDTGTHQDAHTNGHISTNGSSSNGTNGVVESDDVSTRLLVWSSADENGISRLQDAWKSYFTGLSLPNEERSGYLNDLAYTLTARRTHLPWRTFIVSRSTNDMQALVDKFAPATKVDSSPNLAFIFSGQGAQWYAMGRELLYRYQSFYDSIQEATAHLRSLGCAWDLIDELQRSEIESNVNKTEYSQTLCTALQVALVDLLDGFNITPKAVIGHSSGEIAAAYCARAISRKSAWSVAFHRGQLASRLERFSYMKGSMLAVGLSKSEISRFFDHLSTYFDILRLTVACVNSPKSVTISGEESQIVALKAMLDDEQIFCRKLKVGVAYHSFQMHEIAAHYVAALGTLERGELLKNKPQMMSSVTGTWVTDTELLKAEYWAQNLVSPVLFSEALTKICFLAPQRNGRRKLDGSHRRHFAISHLVEVGPHAALQGPSKEILKQTGMAKSIAYLPSLVRNVSAVDTVLHVIGALHCVGYPVDISLANAAPGTDKTILPKCLADLPQYPFDHSKTYWHESRLSRDHRLRKFGRVDLLGAPDPNWNPREASWRNIIKVSEMPWVVDHQVNNTILYPAAGMLVMAVEAVKQLADESKPIAGFNFREVAFHAALQIPVRPEGIETCFYMRRMKETDGKSLGWFDFRLYTYDNANWVQNCSGSIQLVYSGDTSESSYENKMAEELHEYEVRVQCGAEKACTLPADIANVYAHLDKCGYNYGEAFRLIKSLASDKENQARVVGEVEMYPLSGSETIHPTTLDAVVQVAPWTMTKSGTDLIPTSVPTHIDKAWISNNILRPVSSPFLKVIANSETSHYLGTSTNITAFDRELKQVLVEIKGLRITELITGVRHDDTESKKDHLCGHIDWRPDVDLLDTDEIQRLCQIEETDSKEVIDFFTNLDFLLTARIMQTLGELESQEIQLAQPHFNKYLEWMNYQRKVFESSGSALWKTRLNDENYIQEVEDRVLHTNKIGLFLGRVSKNLLSLLTGKLDPLTVMFEGTLAKDFYYEVTDSSHGLQRFMKYLDLMAHKNPTMKILEIGAGTGSLTTTCLRVVGACREDSNCTARYGQWDYTDISRSFFSAAQDSFTQEADRMQFKVLDIEKNPELQGFESGTYDMVIACLVLHATADLVNTLANARKLLKPGGKLVFYESTRPHVMRTAFAFGLLEGWWLSSEPYRTIGPCVDKSRWNELLLQTGFSGCDHLLPDHDDPSVHENSLVVTTAVDMSPRRPGQLEVDIVYEPSVPVQEMLASELAKRCKSATGCAPRCLSINEVVPNEQSKHLLQIFLLEIDRPLLYDISPELFQRLQKTFTSETDILWLNEGGGVLPTRPEFKLIDGLFRALISETGRANRYILSLESGKTNESDREEQIMKVVQLLASSTSGEIDTEYLQHEGNLHIGRLVDSLDMNEEVNSRTIPKQSKIQSFSCGIPLRLDSSSPGLLNGFSFVEDKRNYEPLGPRELEIEVQYVGINFRDVLIAVGRLNSDTTGIECAGSVIRVGEDCRRFQPGDCVVGIHTNCYSSFARFSEGGPVAKVPDGLSLLQAAAIPTNFVTSWIALKEIARTRPGETVLIHSGAGGTGQAAIQIAQMLGATILTTVGSESKKRFLMDFYGIPETHIFSSRGTLFAKAVQALTGNKGVDVILNSLSGEGLLASWECIAPYGRFIEIGKKDILLNQKLPMFQFACNVSFSALDLAGTSIDRPDNCVSALEAIMGLVQEGTLQPAQPLHTFGVSEIETAFRLMQNGKHHGKMVLEMRKDDLVTTILENRPRFSFDRDSSYLISGGFGGLGRSIIHWLVERGAHHLIILSRSGQQHPHAGEIINNMKDRNVQVMAPACDIADEVSLQVALEECQSQMPPIRGCIQAAMVLQDSAFENMTFESWKTATAPKVQGSWNLHKLLPKGMDFFVMLSSISGITGGKGQANYASGNTFQDGLARHRVHLGEKAISLDLGYFAFTGAVAENAELKEKFSKGSATEPVSEDELHALLDYYCDPNRGPSTPLKSQTTAGIYPMSGNQGTDRAYWLNKPLFRNIHVGNKLNVTTSTAGSKSADLTALLQNMSPSSAEANAAVMAALRGKLSKILSVPIGDLDANKPMHQYGVDSLVAVELCSWFSKEALADIAIFDIMGSATITSVAQLAVSRSKLLKET